jgi:hypothetical protein
MSHGGGSGEAGAHARGVCHRVGGECGEIGARRRYSFAVLCCYFSKNRFFQKKEARGFALTCVLVLVHFQFAVEHFQFAVEQRRVVYYQSIGLC